MDSESTQSEPSLGEQPPNPSGLPITMAGNVAAAASFASQPVPATTAQPRASSRPLPTPPARKHQPPQRRNTLAAPVELAARRAADIATNTAPYPVPSAPCLQHSSESDATADVTEAVANLRIASASSMAASEGMASTEHTMSRPRNHTIASELAFSTHAAPIISAAVPPAMPLCVQPLAYSAPFNPTTTAPIATQPTAVGAYPSGQVLQLVQTPQGPQYVVMVPVSQLPISAASPNTASAVVTSVPISTIPQLHPSASMATIQQPTIPMAVHSQKQSCPLPAVPMQSGTVATLPSNVPIVQQASDVFVTQYADNQQPTLVRAVTSTPIVSMAGQTALTPITGKRRALLIGIEYRGTPIQLSGCGAAVMAMRQFLLGTCKYKPSDVLVLTDVQPNQKLHPNRATIINALQWLLNSAAPGDSFVFYYAGRNARLQDNNGEEASGLTNSLMPLDHAIAGYLSSADINTLLVQRIPLGARLMAINDMSTAGSILCLPTVYKSDGSKRGVASDTAGLGAIAALASVKLLFGMDTAAVGTAGVGAARAAKTAFNKNKKQATRGTLALVFAIGRKQPKQPMPPPPPGTLARLFIELYTANNGITYELMRVGLTQQLSGRHGHRPEFTAGSDIVWNTPFAI